MKRNSTNISRWVHPALVAGLLIAVPAESVKAKATYGLTNASCTGWTPNPCTLTQDRGTSISNAVMNCTWTDSTTPTIKSVAATFNWIYYAATVLPTVTLNGVLMATGLAVPPNDASCTSVEFTQTATFPSSAYVNGGINTISFTNPQPSYMIMNPNALTGANNLVLITVNNGPSISTPTPSGFVSSTTPTISWLPLGTATSYQLQIDTVPFFNDVGGALITKTILGTTFYTLSGAAPELLTNAVTYYGRVQPLGGTLQGIWSYISDFTVYTVVPPAPTLVTPINGASTPSQTPTFNWNPVVTGP